jgi:hypothetical protein
MEEQDSSSNFKFMKEVLKAESATDNKMESYNFIWYSPLLSLSHKHPP